MYVCMYVLINSPGFRCMPIPVWTPPLRASTDSQRRCEARMTWHAAAALLHARRGEGVTALGHPPHVAAGTWTRSNQGKHAIHTPFNEARALPSTAHATALLRRGATAAGPAHVQRCATDPHRAKDAQLLVTSSAWWIQIWKHPRPSVCLRRAGVPPTPLVPQTLTTPASTPAQPPCACAAP